MRRFVLGMVVLCAALSAGAQESFRWVDFHSPKDQSIVIWVTHALEGEKWTAIREIGVQYDAALVVTTTRSAPDASPASDTFQVYSVSLKNHLLTALLKGVNLRWIDSLQLAGGERDPALLYDDCTSCPATTYMTAFYYDTRHRVFTARWMRGTEAAPVWTSATPADVTLTQVYAVIPVPPLGNQPGSEFLATWNHFDYGKAKPAQDYLYRYDRDPLTGLDRFLTLSGKDAAEMKTRLCTAQAQGPGMAGGQDSELCAAIAPHARARRVATTPPANNQGRSTPPGSRRRHN